MTLTDKLELILLDGPKQTGTYEYPMALAHYEEYMTSQELETVEGFLTWLVASGRTYGHGNLHATWRDWLLSRKPR